MDRCSRQARPHRFEDFHYIRNRRDEFKREVYTSGPFYTSFYMYEDFPWFFRHFPTHGYARSWGIMLLGGHAVTIVGWESDCMVHLTPVSPLSSSSSAPASTSSSTPSPVPASTPSPVPASTPSPV